MLNYEGNSYYTTYEISYKSPMPMGFGYINLYMSDVKDPIEFNKTQDKLSDFMIIIAIENILDKIHTEIYKTWSF